MLSQGGLNQFSTFGNLNQRIAETGESTQDLAQIGSEERPGFFNLANLSEIAEILAPTEDLLGSAGNPSFTQIMNFPETQKVEITNETLNVEGSVKAEVQNTVAVKQVGVVQVSQSGEFVVRLASGETIPVYVEGGRIVADISGGLEGLAIDLADSEVSLRAVGAI